MILLTTSRRPTGRIRSFCRDLANSIPGIVRVNRGKMSLNGLAEKALTLGINNVLLIDRWHGGPGKINLFQISSGELKHIPPIMLISAIHLRREIDGKVKRIKSSVITINPEDSSKLTRLAKYLSHFLFLPFLPIDDASRRHPASMHLSLGSSQQPTITFLLLSQMIELGPRVKLSKLIWDVSS